MRGEKEEEISRKKKKRKETSNEKIIPVSHKKKEEKKKGSVHERREKVYCIPFRPFVHPRARDFVNVLTAFNIPVHSRCSASCRGPFKRDDRCLARDRHAHDCSSRVALDI